MMDGQNLKIGDAHVTPRNIQEVKASKLGDAQGTPLLHQQKYQVIFEDTIFLLLHILCVILGVLVVFCFLFLFAVINGLCGRETRSTFLCEYSYSSLIFDEYSCLAIAMLLAPVFHASLV
jgi:hypothetical protein